VGISLNAKQRRKGHRTPHGCGIASFGQVLSSHLGEKYFHIKRFGKAAFETSGDAALHRTDFLDPLMARIVLRFAWRVLI
tara:strand:- start:364 stop:603 length:240 start_codon:yes stop_codon:yes gene_type:complete